MAYKFTVQSATVLLTYKTWSESSVCTELSACCLLSKLQAPSSNSL